MAERDTGPGSLKLGQLIHQGHGAALRADLQHHYGLDLADLWRGQLAPRRVLNLVEHLPAGSALAAQLGGDPSHRGWDLHAHLLAHVVDAAHHTAWAVAQAHSRKPVPHPKPLPRPGPRPRRAGPLDLSKHPLAQPLPERYRSAPP
ncbi:MULTISPECIES: hypothetical protein [Streptomyces]|uniref:hypothetical protein n=1 Tax=Streptomyces decoyicus TaxID=249567 RepID=UPI0030BCB32D|nr:hypothetical protein OG532_16695 [Streptomyces decoyicus]